MIETSGAGLNDFTNMKGPAGLPSDLDLASGDYKLDIQLSFEEKAKAEQSRTYILFQRK